MKVVEPSAKADGCRRALAALLGQNLLGAALLEQPLSPLFSMRWVLLWASRSALSGQICLPGSDR